MPSVMDAPELVEYVETHDFAIGERSSASCPSHTVPVRASGVRSRRRSLRT